MCLYAFCFHFDFSVFCFSVTLWLALLLLGFLAVHFFSHCWMSLWIC